MNEAQKIGLEQTQSQRLLPMQVMAGRMLEMNAIELEEAVKTALDELPALEAAENHDDTPVKQEDESGEEFTETSDDIQRADYGDDDDIPYYLTRQSGGSYDPDSYREPVVVAPEGNIIDTLTEQLNEHEVSPRTELIARYIIGNIDDNGYMARDIRSITEDISFQTGLDVTPAEVREVWNMVRSFEPAGIAAVDLRDCLLLQLRRRSDEVKDTSRTLTTAIEIIDHYFDLFSKKHFDSIASELKLDTESLRNVLDLIRGLNPKPASQLDSGGLEDSSRQIVPDFNIDIDDDEIRLTLLNNIPELQIEASFSENAEAYMPTESRQQKEALKFIRKNRDDARLFIRMISQRQQTLFRVMSAIVNLQRAFFLSGDVSDLRPMVLRDVAAITGDDLSVISRATASKYVTTPYGVFPLKKFFSERVSDDEDASTHEIIVALKAIVAQENKKKPLSDEAITAALNKKGYSLARRTVSKYREKEGIPVARLRKEL